MTYGEHAELENKIHNLEKHVSGLEWEIRKLEEGKADKGHHHKQYQLIGEEE